MHPYLNHGLPIALAHRGGAAEWPENTYEAFAGSYDLGFRYIETDVHLSADGVIVAFHDLNLERVGSTKSKIGDLDWEQLNSIRINQQGRIPSMAELFEQFPDMRFNIDMKSDEVITPLIDLIREFDAFDRVCLASFHDRRIKLARSLAGASLCTSAGRLSVAAHVLRSFGWNTRSKFATAPQFDLLQVPLKRYGTTVFSPRFMRQAKLEDIKVHVWTIDDPRQMHQLLDMGVAGIISDRPSILKQVFIERGIWPG